MPKFEIEVEITGFKLKIKGEREALPSLTRSIGKQLSGMLSVPEGLVEDADVLPDEKSTPLLAPAPKKLKKLVQGQKQPPPLEGKVLIPLN